MHLPVPTRRSILQSSAALIAGVSFPTTGNGAFDPIFEVLARARALQAEADKAHAIAGELELTLPHDRRQSCITPSGLDVAETDDPRWIESEHRCTDSLARFDEVAVELLTVQPTTLVGLSALLRYAYEYEAVELREWPEGLKDDGLEDRLGSLSWSVILHRHAADALDAMLVV